MNHERKAALAITAVAIGLRIHLSATTFLNPDECMHLNAGSTAQWGIYHHPPLLLWWLWLATLVSEQVWWLRFLPVLAGGLAPLATGLWLRRFLSVETSWGAAALVAISPNLVLVSYQLRGYSLAMLATLLSLYALERAFAEKSRRMLMWHFVALYLGIVSEFGVAWVVLAAGLYGLTKLLRDRDARTLRLAWGAGQIIAAGIYIWLYYLVLLPLLAGTHAEQLIATYLAGGFPAPGQHPMLFVAASSFKQLVYVGGGIPAGFLMASLVILGLGAWYRAGESRMVLIAGVYLTAAGAFLRFFPFGRSRHSLLTGLISLAVAGAGIDWLESWRARAGRFSLVLLLLLGLLYPMPDVHNIPLEYLQKARMDRALEEMQKVLPAGATVIADGETVHLLRSVRLPRNQRQDYEPKLPIQEIAGYRIRHAGKFEWIKLRNEEIQTMARQTGGPVWVLDTGFSVGNLQSRGMELRLQTMIDEPGVLYLGRLE